MDFYPAPECPVALEVRAPAALRLRPGCGIGHRSTHAAVRALLERAGDAREVTLHFGRMVEYPWLSGILARQASSSRRWDRVAGRPYEGSAERYVGVALAGIPEFTVLFDRWLIASISAEKVLLRPAGELSLPVGSPVAPETLLPYDALVTVVLRR